MTRDWKKLLEMTLSIEECEQEGRILHELQVQEDAPSQLLPM